MDFKLVEDATDGNLVDKFKYFVWRKQNFEFNLEFHITDKSMPGITYNISCLMSDDPNGPSVMVYPREKFGILGTSFKGILRFIDDELQNIQNQFTDTRI